MSVNKMTNFLKRNIFIFVRLFDLCVKITMFYMDEKTYLNKYNKL